jgi:hypothetical protein
MAEPFVNRPALLTFLRQLTYPAAFTDFETYSVALPPFNGLKPYQRVPFQFSVHLVPTQGATPVPISFLADGSGDPRQEFMRRLRAAVGDQGSVVVYNRAFEMGVLKECIQAFPEFAEWVAAVDKRIVDLLQPFRAFRFYHHRQKGSASMKKVLPALTGQGYEHLDIQDGQIASLEYLRVTFEDVSPGERRTVRKRLLDYCGLDTLGMVQIVEAMRSICGE